MSVINKDQIAAAYTAFRADYEAGKLAAQPLHSRIAMATRSTAKEESYSWLGQYNSLREWIGDRHFNGLTLHGFTIKNRTFENTVTVPREDIEDDRIGALSGAFQTLGHDAALHPDSLLFELVRNGTTQTCYDGQYFFDTDHPVDPSAPEKGSVSNVDLVAPGDAPAWMLLDTTKVIKPFIIQTRKDYRFIKLDNDSDENVFMRNEFVYGCEARLNVGFGLWQLAFASNKPLTADNIAAADAAMMGLKSPTGRPLGVAPNILMVAPGMKESALKLLKLDTSHYQGAFELIVCPWL